jgi:hypothetical protein
VSHVTLPLPCLLTVETRDVEYLLQTLEKGGEMTRRRISTIV